MKSNEWRPIETAPKDGTSIVGWCVHEKDKYFIEDGALTTYGAHCEEVKHVEDGYNIVQWGGEYSENDWENGINFTVPNWWFRTGSDFEEVANPTHWMPLPSAPVY